MATTKKYKVKLVIAKKEYSAEATSLESAIKKLNLSWEQIKYKSEMFISYGNKKAYKLFNIQQLRKIMSNKITRMIWAKNFKLMLK